MMQRPRDLSQSIKILEKELNDQIEKKKKMNEQEKLNRRQNDLRAYAAKNNIKLEARAYIYYYKLSDITQ